MSGPIVRKYGFPNFDKIFGAKPLLHGVENDAEPNNAAHDGEKRAEPGAKAAPEPARGPEPARKDD